MGQFPHDLLPGEMVTIMAFVRGDRSLRQKAIEAFHAYLQRNVGKRQPHEWPLEIKFMSEVDNPAPDYSLRAEYRRRLLGQT